MRWELMALGVVALALVGGAVAMIPDMAADNNTATGETATSEATKDPATLTPEEIDGILWMREEEKLARDVYLTLYDMWGLQIFQNIARSEQRHMDAMLSIIEAYGLEDPVQDEIGVFTNPQLQELYNQLVEMGSKSLEDAILVGSLIEETDIVDLQRWINVTDNPDVEQTYENLMSGSANHLKAFSAEYVRLTGKPYQPQVLDFETYQEIVSGARAGAGY